jgi:serine/threonine protein kinase
VASGEGTVMEHTFFEHYRICDNEDGSPVSRSGPAINYKAIDTRSHESVLLQLIPLATVDQTQREQFEARARTAQKLDHVNIAKIFAVGTEHDHFGVVSEYLEGETVDSWVVANGPMPADAVLRVGLQVARALAAAAFFGLTHRAIQPSNLMIVPGQSVDGGWPFVKLLNFGLAGLELHSNSAEARELAPSMSPQFASPEQLLNREIDFRSEVYSLGASMCFLLTGAAPLSAHGMKARLRLRRLPELRHSPRALRNLLTHMLRENPDNRPQDPVAFESEIQDCLIRVERRQAIGRKLGIPLAAAVLKKAAEPKEPRSPLAQIWRGVVAFAVLILAGAAVGAFFFPDRIPFLRRTGEIGVPVGVPDASSFASTPAQATNAAPVVASQPVTSASPNIQQAQSSNAQIGPAASPANTASSNVNPSAQVASAAQTTEPAPPAQGPPEQSTAKQNADLSASAQSSHSSARGKKKTIASTSRSRSRRAPATRVSPREEEPEARSTRARFVGSTPDGRMILRLPSGRTVFVRPRSNEEDVFVPPSRRRIIIERPDRYAPPPAPLYPPDYPFND